MGSHHQHSGPRRRQHQELAGDDIEGEARTAGGEGEHHLGHGVGREGGEDRDHGGGRCELSVRDQRRDRSGSGVRVGKARGSSGENHAGFAEPVLQGGSQHQDGREDAGEDERRAQAEGAALCRLDRAAVGPQRPQGEGAAIDDRGGAREQQRLQEGPEGVEVRHRDQDAKLHDRGDGGHHRAGGGRLDQMRIAGRARAHGADRGGTRDEARGKARQRQAEAGSHDPHRDVAQRAHAHHQDHHEPDGAQVERAIGADRMVGQHRQHDQGGAGEDQQVVDFAVGEHRAHETVEGRAGVQQQGDDHPDAGGEGGLADREPAQQRGRDQCRLRGEAGIGLAGMPVGEAREDDHAQHDGGQQEIAPRCRAGRAGERGEGEGPESRGAAARSFALLALAVDADQQPDTEGHDEAEEEGRRFEHASGL